MSEVHLYVEDTGIGIPHSEQKMIFERFYKRSEFSQGVGLGLSICVLIVERWEDASNSSPRKAVGAVSQ